jgi:hypothetical protein
MQPHTRIYTNITYKYLRMHAMIFQGKKKRKGGARIELEYENEGGSSQRQLADW